MQIAEGITRTNISGSRLTRAWVTGRTEFRRHQMDVDRKDFAVIEHLLRSGRRKIDLYSLPGIKNILT